MSRPKKIRAFIAIPLPENIKFYLRQLQIQLKRQGIRASWPKPETLHLTLKFFGDVQKEKVGIINACMENAASELSGPVILTAAAMGVFPSPKKARVLWAGVRGDTHLLAAFVDNLNGALSRKCDIPVEKKRFLPHLTLSRIKGSLNPQKTISILQQFSLAESDPFKVSKIILFQSRLEPAGAIHTPIFSVSI